MSNIGVFVGDGGMGLRTTPYGPAATTCSSACPKAGVRNVNSNAAAAATTKFSFSTIFLPAKPKQVYEGIFSGLLLLRIAWKYNFVNFFGG
jgi:prolipoprotein diacylglyceryltransferase